MTEEITVVVAEDDSRYREGIVEDLKQLHFNIIGESANGQETLNLFEIRQPDILFLDLNMPVMDGNETFDLLKLRYPKTKIIILSFYCENLIVDDYLKRGCKGYIPKEKADKKTLLDAITTIMAGDTFVIRHKSGNSPSPISYTSKQAALIPLLCQGLTNKDIAEQQGIHQRSVEKTRERIFSKIGVTKAVEFYKYAFTAGYQYLKGMK